MKSKFIAPVLAIILPVGAWLVFKPVARPVAQVKTAPTSKPAKSAAVNWKKAAMFGPWSLKEWQKMADATVSGAGSAIVNGTYPPSMDHPGPYNGAETYQYNAPPPIFLYFDGVGHWCISTVFGYQPTDGIFYWGDGDADNLPTVWHAEDGSLPEPTVSLGSPTPPRTPKGGLHRRIKEQSGR